MADGHYVFFRLIGNKFYFHRIKNSNVILELKFESDQKTQLNKNQIYALINIQRAILFVIHTERSDLINF